MTRSQRERARRDSAKAERRRRSEGKDDSMTPPRDHAGRWANGRYEIHREPGDSLKAYDGWDEELRLDGDPADDKRVRDVQGDLARMVDGLPSDLSGVPRGGFGYDRLADAFRYNRVQGPSIGLGYRYRLPRSAFWSLQGTIRYGFSDQRIMARLAVIRDAPGGRWTLAGYRDLRETDPFSQGQSLGNSFNAIFTAHDDADYYLAQGGSVGFEHSLRRGLDLTLGARVEDAQSVATEGHSAINDVLGGSGDFPANPPIQDGTFAVMSSRFDGFVGRSRWALALEGWLGGDPATGRAFAEWRQPVGRPGRDLMLRLKAGITTAPGLPQTDFRAGGRNTVRAFDYGYQRGPALWALQVDWAPTGKMVRPVLFVDGGQAGAIDRLSETPILVGGGAGVSFLRGLVRLDLSHSITPSVGGVRVDLEFRAAR
jgi:hypothetical protein